MHRGRRDSIAALLLLTHSWSSALAPPGTCQPSALKLLFRGEVAPAHLSAQACCERGSSGPSEWQGAVAAIEEQARVLEARADEVRLAIQRETSVGLQLRHEAGTFKVGDLEATGPAALSGAVQADDKVLAIDGVSVRGLNLFEATALLRGPASSDLVLTLLRSGGATANVTLQRSSDPEAVLHPRPSDEDRLRLAAGGGLAAPSGLWSTGIVLGENLMVEAVAAESAAATAGIRKGDTLLSVDGMRVTGGPPHKVAGLLASLHRGTVLQLLLTVRLESLLCARSSACSAPPAPFHHVPGLLTQLASCLCVRARIRVRTCIRTCVCVFGIVCVCLAVFVCLSDGCWCESARAWPRATATRGSRSSRRHGPSQSRQTGGSSPARASKRAHRERGGARACGSQCVLPGGRGE